jgi:hypothetical protein
MLARKKDYEYLVRERLLPASLQGWRRTVMGYEFLMLAIA